MVVVWPLTAVSGEEDSSGENEGVVQYAGPCPGALELSFLLKSQIPRLDATKWWQQ